MIVINSSTPARFIMASVASMPFAIELVSSRAMAGPRLERAFPFMVAMDRSVRPARSPGQPCGGR